ncbi:Rieske [2Fe-2S] iron-sulfur domain-containing protein [Microdochium trichocladiopsis]|uniref:Choline monooxygenase, chloroplastic n=1 Tax=Microdochium trichocladiopsis TaxID=1682393 RepID=A0A9P8XX79_9PEZI|nr:Rieske [2Fe-2S] iron-sulfur domain-containing protein [Microdochium trichocladiopsis]KAH7020700.1 Rieske [2Fe-2S] iron-sulfur domain-containing protein [Microdochium trichocladiopsis]
MSDNVVRLNTTQTQEIMLRYFGFGSGTSAAAPSAALNLPASWYRSPAMYELERRAVFSQRWILITHQHRFSKAGDFHTSTHAGFSFFLVLDREGNINGFHNMCRHRAYPIFEKKSGTASILSCKYHGWSYGLKGNLAKAPRFDTVEGFDKSKNDLLPIHVYIDPCGFIWVNLEASKTPSISWEKGFAGSDMDIAANWKSLIDNSNECYHCPTSQPLIAGVSDLTQSSVDPNASSLEHTIVNKQGSDKDLQRSIPFFYPSTSATVTDNFFYIQRMLPVTATTSRVENEVFRHKNATDKQFEDINKFYHQVLSEDKDLCDGAQKNMNAGVLVAGELHPEKERGPLYFQHAVRTQIMAHRKLEEETNGGREICPAVPKMDGTKSSLEENVDFCASLDAAALEFFDSEWNFIGSKSDLVHAISEMTNIDEAVLEGAQSLASIPVGRKIS